MYFTNVSITKNRVISFVVTLISMYLLKPYIAARAQLVTFILFMLTLNFIENFLKTGKKRYVVGLIIIPILIANIHLAVFPFYFILYLPYIGEYGIYILLNWQIIIYDTKIKRLKKRLNKAPKDIGLQGKLQELEDKKVKEIEQLKLKDENAYKIKINPSKYIVPLIIIMIVCLFTGLLTPLKLTPYTYLVKTMQGDTTQNISEHLPLILINNTDFLLLLAFYIITLLFTDTKMKLSHLFLFMGLTLLAFITRRQASMMVLLSSIVLSSLICNLIGKNDKEIPIKLEKIFTKLVSVIMMVLIVLLTSFLIYWPQRKAEYVSKSAYPVEASEWILENLDVKNIKLYNEYNYGSYLLFKGIPVFIDSRADLYSPEFNENVNVFTDFLNLNGLNIMNIDEKIEEYGFTHFILTTKAKLNIFIKQNLDKYNEIYKDDHFVIYEKLK